MTDVVAETIYGKVQGETIDGIHSFKGIPYGGPTGGKNRFKPPASPKPWAGVRDATRYGMSCWQPSEGRIRAGVMGDYGIDCMGEDCLVLNVWTPGLNDQRKRPVMVWLHGGGFITGSADCLASYEGQALAKTYDVVVVSVNHRLGVLGHLHLAAIAGEEYADSGNAGALDLVAALEWVRDNIALFGGDAGNVMIYGESGGGGKVCTLLAMPKAKGLFHKAAIQSGANLHLRPLEEAVKATEGFLELAGVRSGRLNDLQEMRTDVLNNAWITFNRGGNTPGGDQSCPVVDGKTIPVHPFDPVAAPAGSDVPVIVGTNKDETTLFLATDNFTGRTIEYDEEKMRKTIAARMGDWWVNKKAATERVDDLIATYRRTRPGATPAELVIAITTDQWRSASIRLAERKAAIGKAPVYMYLFTWESKAAYGRLKSAHGFEIPFVFNNAHLPIRLFRDAPERFKLAAEMSAAWTSFARSGNPNHAGIPEWPAYNAAERATMLFGKETRVENDPAAAERQAWDGIVW